MTRIRITVLLVVLSIGRASLLPAQPQSTPPRPAPGDSKPVLPRPGVPLVLEHLAANPLPIPAVQESGPRDNALPSQHAALPRPSGPQESLVTIEWMGTALAPLGQPTEYILRVRNKSHLAVHRVAINLLPAAGMTTSGTRPGADTVGDVLVWQLGTLLPQQEQSVKVQLVAHTTGNISPQAWVEFTSQSSAPLRLDVYEPKLALNVAGPPRVRAGEPVKFQLTVTNAGDRPSGQVKLSANLTEGLEHPSGRHVDFEIGDLAAGETRTVDLACFARAGGQQKCYFVAVSGTGARTQKQAVVTVLMPTLDVQLEGPGLRYVERTATFTLRILNCGGVPASNVTVTEVIPPGFKFVSASEGGCLAPDTRVVSWSVGELRPGQTRQVQVELLAVKAGEQRHRVSAYIDPGSKIGVTRELVTRVEDFSSLALEIAHDDKAIEVGKEMVYEILITNVGSKTETDIKLICALPDKMELKSAQAPVRYHAEGNLVVFELVPRLAPPGDLVYKLKVKALAPGDVRFKAQVTSTNLVEPVVTMEPTRIYSDQP